jgi:hypothetical protein
VAAAAASGAAGVGAGRLPLLLLLPVDGRLSASTAVTAVPPTAGNLRPEYATRLVSLPGFPYCAEVWHVLKQAKQPK